MNSSDARSLRSGRSKSVKPKTKLLTAKLVTLTLIFGLLTCRSAVAQDQPSLSNPRLGEQSPNGRQRLPDPRYRSPMGVWEIDRVASMVARAMGHHASGRIVVLDEVPLARISGPLEAGEIQINPIAARTIPPNSWAFIIGHEFAHRTHGIGQQGRTSPDDEFRADVIGAEYAIKAGFDLAAHIAWTLSRQSDDWSESHGSLHDRANRLGARFGVPLQAVRMNMQRYRMR